MNIAEKYRHVSGYIFAKGTDIYELEFDYERPISEDMKERINSLFQEGWKIIDVLFADDTDRNYAVFTEPYLYLKSAAPTLVQETDWLTFEQARKMRKDFYNAIILSNKLPE